MKKIWITGFALQNSMKTMDNNTLEIFTWEKLETTQQDLCYVLSNAKSWILRQICPLYPQLTEEASWQQSGRIVSSLFSASAGYILM